MFFGVLLIILGALMLLDRLGVITGDLGDFFWPVVVLAIGVSMVIKNKKDG